MIENETQKKLKKKTVLLLNKLYYWSSDGLIKHCFWFEIAKDKQRFGSCICITISAPRSLIEGLWNLHNDVALEWD